MLVWFRDATQLLHREQAWESWIPLAQQQLFLIRPVCKCKYHLNTHGKSVRNVMEKSWNVMDFRFENCMGTLIIDAFVFSVFQTWSLETATDDCKGLK